jgi:hypothetical protein
MHSLTSPTPLVDANQPTPSGRRSEDFAESLGEAGENPGGYMPIFIGRDHVADRLDLGQRQLLRRTSRARRAIVEAAWRLVTPDVVSCAGQARDAEHGAQPPGMTSLSARRLAVDDRGAKAAIYGLNQVGR